MQDIRVYKGVAKYTSNFIPASTKPDILPDTPSGVSGSSKLTKITDGAVSFDGTNDTLSVPDHADFTFGSGDFTMEAFVYNRSSGYRSIVMKYGGSPAASSWFWSMYNGQNQFYYYSGGNEPAVTSGQTHYNKWVHCAVSREGNTIRIFDNGELTGTLDVSSYDTMNDSTVPLDIGTDYADNYDMDGFISNVRIVKGTALYTKSFTAPTAPLTDVTNTKLLCCQSNASAGAAAVSPQISGGLNSGTVWSDYPYLTTTQGAYPRDFYTGYNYPPSNLFDGDTSTIVYGGWTDDADDNSDLIFRPPGGISVSSKLEVYVGYYSLIKVNGSNYNTGGHNTAQAWVTVSDGSNFTGTLNELILENTTNANVVRAAAIRIDDSTILLDPVLQQNAVATNFNPFNTDINTVRGQETGYPTFNPLDSALTLSDGNLNSGPSGDSSWKHCRASMEMTTGKFYWEYKAPGTPTASSGYQMGVMINTVSLTRDPNSDSAGMYTRQHTTKYINGSSSTPFTAPTTGQTIMFALDVDAGLMWTGEDGVWYNSGNPVAGTNESWSGVPAGVLPMSGSYGSSLNVEVNFGQKPFKFSPPDGFQPLNAANTRPDKVISRPDQYVGVTTYSGTGDAVSPRTVELPFDADLVWAKSRDRSSSHQLVDTVRGNNKVLISNSTDLERDPTSYFGGGGVASIDGKIISIESGSSNNANLNTDGEDAVVWHWKAGGNKNTFNIDDVGYASASAAGMAAGDFNSTAYNTSQRWSDNLTVNTGSVSNATQAFNGNLTNGADSSASTGSNDRVMTVTLGLTLNNETVEVYPNHTYSGYYATIDGIAQSTQYQVTDYGFAVMGPFTGTLTSVSVTNGTESSNRPAGIRAVKVAGKILIDDNITPPNIPNIAPTGASVGTKQGFAIVKYTGNSSNQSTVPHKLLEAPKFVIIKNLTRASQNWIIGHANAGEQNDNPGFTGFRQGNQLYFTSGALDGGTSQFFSGAHPEANYFTVKDNYEVNYLNDDYVAYLWHDVPGLQKFGTYKGLGGTANGAFVELGFRPALVWVKDTANSNSNSHWCVFDNLRPGFNKSPAQNRLHIDANDVEDPDRVDEGNGIDILSNGFRVRSNNWYETNVSSGTYIYCAWAEAPSVDLYGGGANAR